MSTRSIGLDDRTQAYLVSIHPPEHPVLAALRARTAALGAIARMQISVEQGHFLALLVRLLGARRILEIGTFTGYSSTAMALALREGGRIVTLDVSEPYTAIARQAWHEAGVEDRIELRLGPALPALDGMLARADAPRFDLAFVDADKGGLLQYWDRCVRLVRPGGLVLVDNVLWSGRVADPEVRDEDTEAIRKLNTRVRDDPRVAVAVLAAFDGLTVAMVR